MDLRPHRFCNYLASCNFKECRRQLVEYVYLDDEWLETHLMNDWRQRRQISQAGLNCWSLNPCGFICRTTFKIIVSVESTINCHYRGYVRSCLTGKVDARIACRRLNKNVEFNQDMDVVLYWSYSRNLLYILLVCICFIGYCVR